MQTKCHSPQRLWQEAAPLTRHQVLLATQSQSQQVPRLVRLVSFSYKESDSFTGKTGEEMLLHKHHA